MAGLTPTGFEIRVLSQIIADFEAIELDLISSSLDVQATALTGIWNGIMGQAFAELWQILQLLYDGMDPDQATDDQLTGVSLLTGTVRRNSTFTLVKAVQITVGAHFSASAGTMFASIAGAPALQFVNTADVPDVGGSPTTVTVDFQAVVAGPTQCLATTLTVIAQPLAGWTAVNNPTDGIVGTNIETDPNLRLRRAQELSAGGSTTADAIRSDILEKLPLTRSCTVLANESDVTDANGLPPHTIEVIAYLPGATSDDDTALAQLILDDKAAGIGTYGGASKNVKDSQGNEQAVYYTRPTEVDIYIDITVVTDPNTFPSDGATRVKDALAAYGDAEINPGDTVYAKATQGSVFPSPTVASIGVPGVLDISVFKIDVMASPVNTGNLTFTKTQIAVFDTSRINVTVT